MRLPQTVFFPPGARSEKSRLREPSIEADRRTGRWLSLLAPHWGAETASGTHTKPCLAGPDSSRSSPRLHLVAAGFADGTCAQSMQRLGEVEIVILAPLGMFDQMPRVSTCVRLMPLGEHAG